LEGEEERERERESWKERKRDRERVGLIERVRERGRELGGEKERLGAFSAKLARNHMDEVQSLAPNTQVTNVTIFCQIQTIN